MLDTRYIHLHEALGLGAMWLKNSAKIIATQPQNTFRQPERTKTPKNKNPQAREQLMAFLQQKEETSTPITTIQAAQTPNRFEIKIQPAQLWVLSAQPTLDDILNKKLFSKEDGALLQRMFKAINLPENQVQLSCWVKDISKGDDPATLAMFAAAMPEMQHDKERVQAQAILLLGKEFERPQMKPHISELAGTTPVFIIAHPLRIIKDSTLRQPAWDVLQQIQAHLQLEPSK